MSLIDTLRQTGQRLLEHEQPALGELRGIVGALVKTLEHHGMVAAEEVLEALDAEAHQLDSGDQPAPIPPASAAASVIEQPPALAGANPPGAANQLSADELDAFRQWHAERLADDQPEDVPTGPDADERERQAAADEAERQAHDAERQAAAELAASEREHTAENDPFNRPAETPSDPLAPDLDPPAEPPGDPFQRDAAGSDVDKTDDPNRG